MNPLCTAEDMALALESYRPAIHRYLHRNVDCADVAADLFQSICERLMARRDPIAIEDIKAYLFRAARNAIYNHRRDRYTRTTSESQAALYRGKLENRSPERIAAGCQHLLALQEALAELPLLTQEIFLLFRVDGLKQQAIADCFGVHLSTVQKRIASAARHCQRHLSDKDYEF